MSRSELISYDPWTDDIVWTGPIANAEGVDTAVADARRAFADWAEAPLARRRAVATSFAEGVTARREEIARLISRETGKPYWETLTEADSVAAKVAISIRAQDTRAGESLTEAGGVSQTIRHRPHGVLAVIGPFNFPMHLANGHIVPALLAGNAVVFKPSEKTPASGVLMAEIWREAGLPDGVLQVVIGAGEAGRALVSHPEVDGVLFTGGAPAGRAIHRSLVESPEKILALELGGNNSLIAWNVADAEDAAHLIVQSAFVSAGQRCSCARRLIVQDGEQGQRVIDALVALTDRLRADGPFADPQPFLGPVIDNAAAEALLAAEGALMAHGATSLRALACPVADRPLLRPAILDVTDSGGPPDEEYFGPMLQIVRVGDFDSAITRASATRFGLAAGLIGGDEALYRRFWRGVRAGVVNWNRPTTGASSAAPFGGIGASGNHRPSAFYAADYCAFPVAGLESADARFRLAEGVAA